MKLLLIILFLLMTMTTLSKENKKNDFETRIFGTLDMNGAVENQDNLNVNDSFGFQLFAEKVYRYNKEFEFSYGLGIQMNDKVAIYNGEMSQFYSAPLYAGLKYNIFGEAVYIKGKLGVPLNTNFNFSKSLNSENNLFNQIDLKNKKPVFWGLSIGLDYGVYEWELSYSINSIEYTYEKENKDIKDSLENIRVSVGYSKKIK